MATWDEPLKRMKNSIVNNIVHNFNYYTDFKLGTEGYISYIKSNELYETLKKDEENRAAPRRKGDDEGGREMMKVEEGGREMMKVEEGGRGRNGTRSESQEWLMEKLKAIDERNRYSPGLDVHPKSANGLQESGGSETVKRLNSVNKTKVLEELLTKSIDLNDIMIKIDNKSLLGIGKERVDAERKANIFNNNYRERSTSPETGPSSHALKNLSRNLERIFRNRGIEEAGKVKKENLIRYIMYLLNNYEALLNETTLNKIQDLNNEISTVDKEVKDNLGKIYTNMEDFYQSLEKVPIKNR
tara:strand:+ start:830 stop:1729 length:900 start_codon:yes stop_codon:yes gene_type:complete